MGAGAIIGLGATLTSFTRNAQSLDQLSIATGENIQTLQAWKLAAQDMGVSGDSMTSSIAGLNAAMGRVKTQGYDPILDSMARLGISARGANGQLKQGSQIAREFARATVGMDERTAADFAAQLGINGEAFYAIRRMGTGIDGIINKKRLLANTTREDIERNRRWQATVGQLNNLWQSFARTLAINLLPVLQHLASAFGTILQYKPAIYAMLAGLSLLIVGGLITAIKTATMSIFGMGAALWTALAPILPILLAIASLTAGVAWAVNKYIPESESKSLRDTNSWGFRKNTMGQSALLGARTTAMAQNSASTYNTSNVRVDNVAIHTSATDARGVANSFASEMKIIGAQGGIW